MSQPCTFINKVHSTRLRVGNNYPRAAFLNERALERACNFFERMYVVMKDRAAFYVSFLFVVVI